MSDPTQQVGNSGSLIIGSERPAVAEYPAGAVLAIRRIDDHELVWTLQGRATFLLAGTTWVMGTGDLLFIPPGVPHAFAWDEQRTSRHGYVHFTMRGFGTVEQPVLRRAGEHDPIAGLLRYLLWLGTARGDWAPRAAQVIDLLVTLLTVGPLPERPTERHQGLVAALHHVASQWQQMPLRRLTIGELARASSVSVTLLQRLFRAEFDASPTVVLEGARLLRARALLLETSMSVEAVGLACGFADAAHFAHRCRAVLGATPSQVRDGATIAVDDGAQRLMTTLWSI